MQVALEAPVSSMEEKATAHPIYWRRLAKYLVALAAAWLLWPALFATHVEAFSARLQTMAMMDLRGQFARDDLAYPINLEYFSTTRGGTVHALEWLMRLTHSVGEVNFRILILLSFALFIATSVAFVRRWSEQPVWTILTVLILTPGLVEISFYFADNLPSAAMVTLAMALPGRRTMPWTWFAAGAALACGALFRIDAIVAAPAIALLALFQEKPKVARLPGDWVALLAGSASVFYAWWRLTGISLKQSLLIGKLHNGIHNAWGDRPSIVRVIVLFFGPTVLLIAIGVANNWRERTWEWKVVMVGWPTIFYAVFLFKAVELRDYLLLGAPFVLLQGSFGLTWLLRALEAGSRRQRRACQWAVGLYGLSLVAPPLILMQDGPRLAVGRIYSPLLWRRWQRSTNSAIDQLHGLGASVKRGESIMVISTLFQSDRYLHLALLEDGYAELPLRSESVCGGVETYQKDGRTIFHIRTENPYYLLSSPPLYMPDDYVRAYQLNSGLQCLAGVKYDRAVMVTWGRMWQGYLLDTPEFMRHSEAWELPFPERGAWHIGKYKYLGVQRLIALSADDSGDLWDRTKSEMRSFEEGNRGEWRKPENYQQFHMEAEPLVWRAADGGPWTGNR